jgi:hypothetical protein
MQQTETYGNFLGYKATVGQQEIVGCVLDPKVKRLIISCMTRYGKTRFVAIGLLLLIANTPIVFNQKPKRILIIAPRADQTKILRGYISEHIAKDKTLSSLVDKPNRATPERLKAEMSKQRITFKNGWELITLTAYAGENEADPAPNLMGWGGDIVVVDEACLIRQTVYTSRISRMLGDDAENSKLIVIVNPWNKLNFAWEAWQNPLFTKIHIDYQQALTEERTTQAYLNEQKTLLSEYEWQVLYESNFADESEDTLIRYDWIERASTKQILFTSPTKTVWAADIAEQGADLTILSTAKTDGIQYAFGKQQRMTKKETIPVANELSEHVPKTENFNIDSIGVGAGVYSQLKTLGYNVISVRVGEAPIQNAESKKFLNLKSQRWWHVRELFEKDLISIPRDPVLMSQLSQIRWEYTTISKIKIRDPKEYGGKSPDHADSLMLTLIEPEPKANPSFLLG